MPLLVAIDVPQGTQPEYAVAVAASCNAALGEGKCTADAGSVGNPATDGDAAGEPPLDSAEASPSPPSESTLDSSAPWVALVRWDDADYRTLRIELRQGAEQPPVEARVVAFTPADPPRQRWAAAGLVIAALVSRREAEAVPRPVTPQPQAHHPQPPPIEPPPPEPEVVEPPPVVASSHAAPRHPWARIDSGGIAGPGLDSGQARLGGLLRLSVVPSRLPLALYAASRYAVRGGQPTVRWVDGSLGVAVRLGAWRSSVALELEAEGVTERVWLTADDPARNASDVARLSRLGGRLGADGIFEFAAPAALFVGVDASLLRPKVVISVGGDEVGTEPPIRWSSSTGLRVSF